MKEDARGQSGEEVGINEEELMDRKGFFLCLMKWSKIVIGSTLLGSALLNTSAEKAAEAAGAAWANRAGGGGAAWANHGGGGAAWANRGGGGGAAAWANHGGGGTAAWANRGAAWVNRGAAWVNRY